MNDEQITSAYILRNCSTRGPSSYLLNLLTLDGDRFLCAATIVQYTIYYTHVSSTHFARARAHRVHVSRRPNRVIRGLAKPFIATVAQPLRSPPHRILGSAPR